MSQPADSSLTRVVVSAVVGISTYAVTKAVVKSNVAEPENLYQKATLAIGSMAIATMVADKTADHVDRQLRTYKRLWNKTKDQIAEQNANQK